MKKLALILIGLILLSCTSAFAESSYFTLLNYPRAIVRTMPKIMDNHIEPMLEAFGLSNETEQFRNMGKNQLVVTMNLSVPRDLIESYRYSVIRDEVELNEATQTVRAGDTIVFLAEAGEIGSRGNDWIAQGGSVDSPPIEMVSIEKFNELEAKFTEEFNERYIANLTANNLVAKYYAGEEPIPVFDPQTIPINEMQSFYVADNGYRAYLIPMANGRKAGIQVFCAFQLSVSQHFTMFACENNGNRVECKIDSIEDDVKIEDLQIKKESACITYIDRVIKDGKANKAGWWSKQGGIYSDPNSIHETYRMLPIQVIDKHLDPPIPKFNCEETDQMNFECDASDSTDPDGEITEYSWSSPYHYIAGITGVEPWIATFWTNIAQSVTLTVTDDHGLAASLTKTIGVEGNETSSLLANYNEETKKVEIDLECSEETATAYIDKMDTSGELIGAVIEKVEIPCNEITDVGPITVKGGYQVTALVGGFEEKAIFAVEE